MATVDLERALLLADLAAPVRWDEVTGSTNDTAMAMAADGAPEWTLVGAAHQTQGRGRLDRSWIDRPGGSLTVSVVLRPPIPVVDTGVLTLLAGAAWAEAGSTVGATTVRCKWPNDLLLDPGKVGGILAASEVAPDGTLAHVVIGAGINLTAPVDVAGATGLGSDVDPTVLLATFLRRFRRSYHPGDRDWSASALDRWRSVADTLGRRVRADRVGGGTVEGVALDIDERGGLIVDTTAGAVTIALGDVQHLS